MAVWWGLTNSWEKKRSKRQRRKERYTHLSAEFQRIARTFLSDQCKEIEENNRMGKIRDLFKKIRGRAVLRWQRNRMGIPLYPPQIHQKTIWMLSKFHKTTSECRQRTSGTQKSNPSLQKEVGKNIKDKKKYKRGRDGVSSREGSLKKREVSKHQETFSLPNLCRALEAQRTT